MNCPHCGEPLPEPAALATLRTDLTAAREDDIHATIIARHAIPQAISFTPSGHHDDPMVIMAKSSYDPRMVIGASNLPIEPRFDGRFVRLRPVGPEHVDALRELSMRGENLWRYRTNGHTVSPDEFERMLWSPAVLAQFVVLPVDRDEIVGHVAAYEPDFRNQHVHIAVVLAPEHHGQVWPLESLALFIDFLFTVWPFRKLYAEAAEFNAVQFAHGLRELCMEEGRKIQHFWHAGRWWDLVSWALWRETWELSDFAQGRYMRADRQEIPT